MKVNYDEVFRSQQLIKTFVHLKGVTDQTRISLITYLVLCGCLHCATLGICPSHGRL